LFRSDDGGLRWTRMSDNPELVQRPWYYMHIFAHPTDPETVYVLNLGVWRSHDGGAHFEEVPNPYGDNHDLWIDPGNPDRMILGNDGGASVTLNNGRTWSSLYNQPTGQFYHVVTDNQEWYRVYGAQQDNTTLSVPSRVDAGTISLADCYPVGGGESGYIAVRPDDPNIVYAGSYASRMTRYDHRTKSQVDITVWPEDPIGYGAGALRYRFQWTFPIVLSPHDPDVLFAGGNVVFRSRDGGQEWTPVSPDLTRHDPATLGSSGGPITQDNVSTEYYATVFAFAESPVQPGLYWAGSDDGLVHVSHDGGATWTDVTPPELPEWALISIIEPSPHRTDTAYVAATRYKLDDPAPYLFRTDDAGGTWTRIVDGIRPDDYTRVVREDPKREGLLYAGTETGLYVSFDRGARWETLDGGFPVVPVHDLAVHDDALVAATHGRGFYVLDNLAPVRHEAGSDPERLYLAAPLAAYRGSAAWVPPAHAGERTYLHATHGDAIAELRVDADGRLVPVPLTAAPNPPFGLQVDYRIPEGEETPLLLQIEDADGNEIRRFASDAPQEGEPSLSAKSGYHRFLWDLRVRGATLLPDSAPLSPYWGGGLDGPQVVPGSYRVILEHGEERQEASFEVRPHPGSQVRDEDFRAQFDLLLAIRDKLSEVHQAVADSRRIRQALSGWEETLRRNGAATVADAARSLHDTLFGAEGQLVESRGRSRADSFNYPPQVNSKLASLQSTVSYGDARPPAQCFAVYRQLAEDADRGLARLRELLATDVPRVSGLIREAGIDPLA
ncbi:MAG: WD40/YVTN/BNR-like repeat-containing protein, partial [Clostridia bacterium]